VFDSVSTIPGTSNIVEYPFFDYFRTRINATVGNYPTVQIPADAREGFTIQTITLPELFYIFESEGDYAVFLGGTWCPYTSPTDAYADRAAKANGVKKVYQFDLRLDGATADAGLKRVLASTEPTVVEGGVTYEQGGPVYGKLVEYLTNLELEGDAASLIYYPNGDTSKPQKTALSIGVPFFFEWNKDHVDAKGSPAPVRFEWIGWQPFNEDYFPYAWYQRANVVKYVADPAFRTKLLGRPIDTDIDKLTTSADGDNSASVGLPAFDVLFKTITENRANIDPWDYTPTVNPADSYDPNPAGGCGGGEEVDYNIVDPILGHNGSSAYDVTNYSLHVVYNEPVITSSAAGAKAQAWIKAQTIISAKALEELEEISFDFRKPTTTLEIKVNGEKTTAYRYVEDEANDIYKLIIDPVEAVEAGADFTVDVLYRTVEKTYLYNGHSLQGIVRSANSTGATLIGEPNGSSFWFPSNNNTTDRATYDIALTAQNNLKGVSIGTLDSTEIHGTQVTRHWKETNEVIPFQVFASFGDYVEFYQEITLLDGTKLPSWSYADKSLYEKNATNKAKIYNYAKELESYVQWAEATVGKYPASVGFVIDNLTDGTNSVGYSLETSGRPFFSGIKEKSTFIHEFLHQWFGDSLTIASWEDLWLAEGFASYFSNVYYDGNKKLPGRSVKQAYAEWFSEVGSDFWELAPAKPRNENNLFGDVSYGRGAFALAALRVLLGDDDFFAVIQAWTEQKAGQSVSSADFVALAEEVSNVDLTEYAAEWIYGDGAPSSYPTKQLLKNGVIHPTSITVAPKTKKIDVGTELQLEITFTPPETTEREILWTSDDETVATVSNTGLVTALSEGVAKISAVSTVEADVKTVATITVNPAPAQILRYAGSNRVDTANQIALAGWKDGAETVVLASGANFADSLSGGTVAKAYDAPLLLTLNGAALETSIVDAIKTLNAEKVVILGGGASVKEAFELTLKDAGVKEIERLADSTRYTTAIAIAKALAAKSGEYDTIFLADGTNYPDTLSAAPVAALKGQPILFTNGKIPAAVTAETLAFIEANAAIKNVVIIGGTGSVSQAVEDALKAKSLNVKRLSGTSRYLTALSIYNEYKDTGIFTDNVISVTIGTNFPDALAGSAYSAKIGAPLFLLNNTLEDAALKAATTGIAAKTAYVYGGAIDNEAVTKYVIA
jgi:putative cell wall-binding protein